MCKPWKDKAAYRLEWVRRLRGKGVQARVIGRIVGISRATVFRMYRRLDEAKV